MSPTRREVLWGALAGGTLAAARLAPAFAQANGDAPGLVAAMRLSQDAAYVYDLALARNLLAARKLELFISLRDHCEMHAGALGSALAEIGAAPPARPTGLADLDTVAQYVATAVDLGSLQSRSLDLEVAAVRELEEIVPAFQDAKHIQLAASILACRAGQAATIVR